MNDEGKLPCSWRTPKKGPSLQKEIDYLFTYDVENPDCVDKRRNQLLALHATD